MLHKQCTANVAVCGNCVYLCLETVFKVIAKARPVRSERDSWRPGRGSARSTAASLSHESQRQFNALHLTFGICSDPGPCQARLRQELCLPPPPHACRYAPAMCACLCMCVCVCVRRHSHCVCPLFCTICRARPPLLSLPPWSQPRLGSLDFIPVLFRHVVRPLRKLLFCLMICAQSRNCSRRREGQSPVLDPQWLKIWKTIETTFFCCRLCSIFPPVYSITRFLLLNEG